MKTKVRMRILLISIITLALSMGIFIYRINRFDHFHLNEKASVFKKITGTNVYTLYNYFYPKSKRKMMSKIVKTENRVLECNSENLEGYQVVLREYIYDGISAYACFSVENISGTTEGLELFGCGPYNATLSDRVPMYGLVNACGKGSVNLSLYSDQEVYRNKKYLFYNGDFMNVEEKGYPEGRTDLRDRIYLIDNNQIEHPNIVPEEAVILSFPLEKTTECYGTTEGLTKVTVTPLQIQISGKARCELKELVVYYKDGSSKVGMTAGETFINLLGESHENTSDEGVECIYKFANVMDFEEIDRIEGKLKNARSWSIKIDSE